MACTYKYKGRTFDSELELDDFLLEKAPFEPTLGDLVFQMTAPQLKVAEKLDRIAKESKDVKKRMDDVIAAGKVVYDADGNMSVEDPPYIGVNKFLSGLTVNGELLFPEFREDEYWKRRYNDWKSGSYTDAELEEFGFDKNNPPKVTNEKLQNQMRDQMKNKWSIQAKTGSAIHSALQICFQKTKDTYNFEMDDKDLTALIKKNADRKYKKYLNDKAIQDAIEYARKLHKDLTEKFNGECEYYPEFVITQDTNTVDNPVKLMGIIDLLIIDKQGRPHILDYKTSIHDYVNYSAAKKLAYSYQLATYQRMLQKSGINTYSGELFVAPIKIENFRKEGDSYVYDGVSTGLSFESIINTSINSDKMWDNIDEFMPAPFTFDITTEDAMKTTANYMSKWFVEYSPNKKITRDQLIRELKEHDLLKPNDNGEYTYRRFGKEAPIVSRDEVDFIDKVLKYRQAQPSRRLDYTGRIKNVLKGAISNGIKSVDFPTPIQIREGSSSTWLQEILNLYCTDSWRVQDNSLLENFGIITLVSESTKQIDFIRVSTSNLLADYVFNDKKKTFRKGTSLVGAYEEDVVQMAKSGSLMLEARQGNVELMETLLLINQMRNLGNCVVGRITAINPLDARGVEASNEELLYCWRELNKHDAVPMDNLMNGNIKFATKYELARNRFNRIMREGDEKEFKGDFRFFGKFKSCRNILDANIDADSEDRLKALNKLLNDLSSFDKKLNKVYKTEADIQRNNVILYNDILMAIAQEKGVNFRQQLKDHDAYFESLNVFKKGMSGTYLDNPGNMNSETLNLVTKLVTEAYQNVRDEMQQEKLTIQKLVRDLKKEKGITKINENTVGNQASLYKNMFREYKKGGDFLFKNIKELHGAEKAFLEHVLWKINKNRLNKSDEELIEMRDNDNIEYYRVPLARGGDDSIASVNGLMALWRAKLKYLIPKNAIKRAREKVEGVFNADEDIDQQQKSELMFKMTNAFDKGEDTTKRLEKLATGIENFEHNVETLVYKHMFAYSTKNNMDGVFPMIKAAMVHICTQGAIQNNLFSNDIKYFQNYIRNKIFNQSIVSEKLQNVSQVLSTLRLAASKLTLGFAPVQFLYQSLQGLWTDISLFIRKPDGKDSFTFNHFKKALKTVYADAVHFSETPTLCSSLNELYALNDMDMNTYVERISHAKKGIWNFTNFLFKFASRPDYYNRMSIFLAQMMGDGCFEAHSVNQKGELVYDWTKDKRFDVFAKGLKNNPKYKEQEARYYTIAKQFVVEHAKNKDGSSFKLDMIKPMPLPRAYTNKEAESLKSLSDNIYGYYSHEKKSLIHSTFLGAMWLHFKTYWSGKKNQYLQQGGVRLRGSWEHYEENGQKYYYQVDQYGNTLFNEPPLTETEMKSKGMPLASPVVQWKGQWQEGIFITLADFCHIASQEGFSGLLKGNIRKAVDAKWNNPDENLRLAYRSNIKQAGYDFGMLVIGGCILSSLLGDWLDELKDPKNKDVATGLGVAMANIAVMSVRNSFLDFNTFDSIGGVAYQWTPYSFEWGGRTMKNVWNVAMGDTDFWDGVVNTSSALKQVKPFTDAIKPDMFRTKREGGTFGE